MSILLTLTLAVAATPSPPHRLRHHTVTPYRGEALYSLAARRRFQHYLRFRLLEMKLMGLERARAVIEHRLDVDSLLPHVRESSAPPPAAAAHALEDPFALRASATTDPP